MTPHRQDKSVRYEWEVEKDRSDRFKKIGELGISVKQVLWED